MKYFNLSFCFLFIFFAGLQYNDPDPYIWMPIYLYAAVLCWLAARRQYYRKACVTGILVYSLYAIYKIFDPNGLLDWIKLHHAQNITASMQAEQPWVEEVREFFGLVILMVVLSINYFFADKKLIDKKLSTSLDK
jgi:Transmembrane family 220, helix